MNQTAEAYEDNISAWSEEEQSNPMIPSLQDQLHVEVRRREELEEHIQSMTETIYSLEEETCKAIELEEHVKQVQTENIRLKEIVSRFWINIKDLIDRIWPDGPDNDNGNSSSALFMLCKQIDDFAHLLKSFLDEMDLEDDSMTSKEDVLWFVKELSWRFEKIAAMEHHHRNDSKNSFLQLLDHQQTQTALLQQSGGHHIPLIAEETMSFTKNNNSSSTIDHQLETSEVVMDNDSIHKQEQEEKIKSLEDTVTNLTLQLEQANQTIITNDENYRQHQNKQNSELQSSKDNISSLESALKSMHLEYNSLKKRRSQHQSNSNSSNIHEGEIVKLAMALEKSELNRAKLLEEFQEERRENARNIQRLMEKFQNFVDFNDF